MIGPFPKPPERVLCVGGPLDGHMLTHLGAVRYRAFIPNPREAEIDMARWMMPMNQIQAVVKEYEIEPIAFKLGSVELHGWAFVWKHNKDTKRQLMMKLMAAIGEQQ